MIAFSDRSRHRRSLGLLTALGVLVSGLILVNPQVATAAVGPAPNEQRSASTVTADPLPTVQIDSGIVWTQTIVGSTVYAGGLFDNARPAGAAPGTKLIPRKNILAYDINTGVIKSFAPVINGVVKTLASSPDGKRLYVGGTFTSVNGKTRHNIAAFDTATGALSEKFKPSAGGSYVNAIAATATNVYVGGLIGAGNGVTRKNFAAFRADTGGLRGWAPTSDLQVDALVIAPTGDKVIAGGRFSLVNNKSQRGLAALDLTDGRLLPWQAPTIVKNGMGTGTYKGKAGIWSLTTDATSVYGTGWVYANVATGNLEGTFSAASGSGAINWIADCHGDHYGVYSDGRNVYTTSHQHACESMDGPPQAEPAPGNLRHATAYTAAAKGTLSRSPHVGDKYADWSGYPAPAAINWYPDWTTGTASGSGQAGWTVTGNGKYVVVGGEFPYVNGKRQQGLVRFSNAAPSSPTVVWRKEAPRLSGNKWPGYAARSDSAGEVRISIPANWDRDDLNITHRLYRSGTSSPLQSKTVKSRFWDRPMVTFVDSGRPPGSTQTYRVVASDANGNIANSNWFSVVVSSQARSANANSMPSDGANPYSPQFSVTAQDLSASFNADTSSVPPGESISSYNWNFGDNSPEGSGVSTTHAYSAAGSYTVTLTVTTSSGATGTTSKAVTVSAPPAAVDTQPFLASDDFERSVTSGWGTAPVGGSWSEATGLSVASGAGQITSAPGQTKTALLSGVIGKDVDVAARFAFDRVADGGDTHFNLLSRKTAAGDYRLKVRVSAAGAVTVNLGKVVGTTETLFAGRTHSGYTYQAGAALDLRLNVVTSGGTTQLQAKVWPAGTAEPTTWTTTATDSTPELHEPGKVGVSTYLTGSVTDGEVVTSVDAFDVK